MKAFATLYATLDQTTKTNEKVAALKRYLAAAPPEDPPGVRERSHGLRVAPKTALNVCDPAPNSGVFVLPITSAPAARSRSCPSIPISGRRMWRL